MRIQARSRDDEVQRVTNLYEDNMVLVKETKLESEALKSKIDVLKTEYYKLESTARQGTADIRAELAVAKERLANYELIEKELSPDTNPAFLNILGNLYYQTSDYPSTEIYMLRALKKFPSLRRSWRTLALSYVQRGMMDQAIDPLIKVIELGGGDAQSYGLLAYAHLNEAHYESALSAYRMARMFDPNSFDFKRGQAMCLIKTEQLRSAIALFDELIVEKPEESTFWVAQANAFLSSEQTVKAIANLQMLSDAGTSTWESQRMLGDLYLNEDLSKLALDSYAMGYRKHPPVAASQAVQPLIYLVGRRCFEEAQTFFQLIQSTINQSTIGKFNCY